MSLSLPDSGEINSIFSDQTHKTGQPREKKRDREEESTNETTSFDDITSPGTPFLNSHRTSVIGHPFTPRVRLSDVP